MPIEQQQQEPEEALRVFLAEIIVAPWENYY